MIRRQDNVTAISLWSPQASRPAIRWRRLVSNQLRRPATRKCSSRRRIKIRPRMRDRHAIRSRLADALDRLRQRGDDGVHLFPAASRANRLRDEAGQRASAVRRPIHARGSLVSSTTGTRSRAPGSTTPPTLRSRHPSARISFIPRRPLKSVNISPELPQAMGLCLPCR